jgi:thioesterase domain-containing protein
MRHWQLKSPASEQEWQRYYQLRWQILRAPWQQPPGSERDALEADAFHLMLITAENDIAAVGRIHRTEQGAAQVRYMAVADAYQGKGAGSRVLAALEQQAARWGCQFIRLNARDSAMTFYQRHGYSAVQAAPTQFGIAHTQMQKCIRLAGSLQQYQQWCQQLSSTWQQTIPLSQFMQLSIHSFDGNELRCQAPLAPNINLHQTMFAGSIYALATLTGWGMLYLQLQAKGLSGAQVLADASIKYFSPVSSEPQACCVLQQCIGDLDVLAHGKKAVQHIRVQIYSAETLAAEFAGKYAVLPHKG